jgi:glycosyltransferase involved in cell wall biosynthesis
MSLYIDLSEFLAVPMKTGIQRISGEICKYMPPGTIIPVRLKSDHYVTLPPTLIDAIGGYFRETGEAGLADISRLGAAENGSLVNVSPEDTVLVPEIFGEQRAAFFLAMSDEKLRRCRFIIYDLLPLTHPEYFPLYVPSFLSAYFQVVRQATCCGFISEHTRDVYYRRLKRTDVHGGVVLPLGSDSLGPRAARPRLNRSLTFSVLGTIEPRKNHDLILEAFEPLLRQIEGLSLSFIGKIGWINRALEEKVRTLASDKNSGFHFRSAPDDGSIRNYIEQSRATIYVSSAEGYGLPPVESLWLGTPVIASKANPSLERLGSTGVHYVDPLAVNQIRRAVVEFLDDGYANRKVEEAAELTLPTWRSFTDEIVRWCAEGNPV